MEDQRDVLTELTRALRSTWPIAIGGASGGAAGAEQGVGEGRRAEGGEDV